MDITIKYKTNNCLYIVITSESGLVNLGLHVVRSDKGLASALFILFQAIKDTTRKAVS